MVTACELAVKEYYGQKKECFIPLLEEIQSPPIVKLVGSMFLQIFGYEFPKNIRKDIGNCVTKRNSLIHSINSLEPTNEELIFCYSTVLKSLNFLNKDTNLGLYNPYYEESVRLDILGNNEGKLELSKNLKKGLEEGEVVVRATIDVYKK